MRDPVKEAKQDAKKIVRTVTRLKHSLAADAELRDQIEEVDLAIDAAAANGTKFSLDVPGLLGLPEGE